MRHGCIHVTILALGALGPAVGAVFSPPFAAALADPASGSEKPARGTDRGPRAGSGARDPGCIYGKVLDGHTGEIRCLSPDEVAPRGPYDTAPPSDAGADASIDASAEAWRRRDAGSFDVALVDAAIPLRSGSVTVEAVDFQNGDVPRAQAALERLARKELTRCATEHEARGDRRRATGDCYIELRFLVRAPGRAEGVDVSDTHGVSDALVQCVTAALANRAIGAPSAEPVAVTVKLRFR